MVPPLTLAAVQEGQFLLPGFIDTHLHAPQYAYTGTGTHIPLMEWLDTVRGPHPAHRLPGWLLPAAGPCP